MPFSDQLKQQVELHKATELAMKDLIVRLWPTEPMPSSYFGLVKQLVSARLRLEAIKRSVCIEGAQMPALGKDGCQEADDRGAA